jgi:hypothetical protein
VVFVNYLLSFGHSNHVLIFLSCGAFGGVRVFEIRKDEEDVKSMHDAFEGVVTSFATKVKKTHTLPKTLNKLNVQV